MGLPRIMGILNITPDSFSDGGKHLALKDAVGAASAMLDAGVDILDLGAESSRPGAMPVAPTEEQARLLPVLQAVLPLAKSAGAMVSVDTRNAATMQLALALGVDMINDISALRHDAAAFGLLAASRAKIVLMHMQGSPETMQQSPFYENVVEDVFAFFQERLAACAAQGIARARCIIDPGIGFGKTLTHNLELLAALPKFRALGVPILVGASRKRLIADLAGGSPQQDRLAGSLALAIYAAKHGADMLRVHDVPQTLQALKVAASLVWHDGNSYA